MLFLNHAKVDTNAADSIETLQHVTIPAGLETARGRRPSSARAIVDQVGVNRRDWIRALRPERAADRHLGFEAVPTGRAGPHKRHSVNQNGEKPG
jgi:hypothetical protein